MREPNIEALLGAVQDGKPWMARFTGKEYARALQEYRERYASLFREAMLDEDEAPALAEVLLDGLAEGWARRKPWDRSMAQMNDKQMLVCFLSPMLLEDPVCAPLAESLREGWAARWPKEAYRVAPAGELQRGFRPTLWGFPLPFGD